METIGLIAAMTQESVALLRLIKGWQRVGAGKFRGQSFELSGQICYLVTSGMGMRRAGEAARSLLEETAPRLLISFGIAGAVEAELQIGDVITAEAVCRLEQGAPGPYRPREAPPQGAAQTEPLLPLARWSEAAREAAARALSARGARLFAGTAVTTGGSQVRADQLGEMPHPILEMETAGIAPVAAEKGIPLFSLRAISDGPCAPIPLDLGEIFDEDANLQAGRMLKAFIRCPAIVWQSRHMLRNTRIAARNAAVALAAALRLL